MRMAVVLSREEISKLGYPVVVEGWHHAVGNGSAGRQRRAFHAEFTEAERIKARKIYNTFYRWYLRTGTPDKLVVYLMEGQEIDNPDNVPSEEAYPYTNLPRTHTITTQTFKLMKRLCDFFGTI